MNMFGNLSESTNNTAILATLLDKQLPFSEYIAQSRAIIQDRRYDLKAGESSSSLILDANSPFEFYPAQPLHDSGRLKFGVLLIHGLLDCPFSVRDIGLHLQTKGMLCRSILLPGHGTRPDDLLTVSYNDWIKAVEYGVESLRQQVDKIFLIGYSTGAALSVYQAVKDTHIAGVILLAPAIRIKAPVNAVVAWHYLKKWLRINPHPWLYQETEIDYAKYLSITFNAVTQVARLTNTLKEKGRQNPPHCPVFMAVSREDETISSHKAIDFFSSLKNPSSKMLLYSSCDHRYPDLRIETRLTRYPELNINHFSHVSLPFSPANVHYGQYGDYEYASRIQNRNFVYGAYNRIEVDGYEWLLRLKCIQYPRRELTYNPDFEYMAEQIAQFIMTK